MDSEKLIVSWNEVCQHVKTYDGVDESQTNAFFSRLQPQAMSDGFLMLTADNDFIKTWIERHYLDHIKQALIDIYHMPYTVLLEVDTTQSAAPAQPAHHNPIDRVSSDQSSKATEPMGYAANSGAEFGNAVNPSSSPAAQSIADGYKSYGEVISSSEQNNQDGALRNAGPNDGNGTNRHFENARAEQQRQNMHFMSYQSAYDGFDTSYDHYREHADSKNRANRQYPAPTYNNVRDVEDAGDRPSSMLTFENFVIGDSNRMAYSMAVNVAETPGGTPLNPLFIYGKSGLGKTHLMRAIQNYIRETQPYLRTIYVDSAELLSDYMDAGAAHDKEKASYKNFKTRYEEADVLLIDDIQYLQGKKQTLDIVFQIFNKLTNQGKQIVLSADRAPKNIDIDERYHSRFNQGGTIDIQPPEIETKLGIVKSFINEYKRNEGLSSFSIPEDIQMYIAENSSSNIRELKSAITKVIYQMTFFNQPDLNVADVRALLENHFSGGSSKNLTVEDIQKEVETFFKVKHSDLIGPKRARNIVYPRQIAIYLCRQLLDLPFNDIGKKFNRDHSTAMHSVATVEEMMRDSREVQEEVETLKQIIREI